MCAPLAVQTETLLTILANFNLHIVYPLGEVDF
jgi:hypothetical protein